MAKRNWLIILGVVTLSGIILGIFAISSVKAQDQSITDIANRLKQRGVPVEKFTIAQRIPFEIEIDLQSTSNNGNLAISDNWYIVQSIREVEQTYQQVLPLSSYKINVYNLAGQLISSDIASIKQNYPTPTSSTTSKQILDNTSIYNIL